jgi:hypothetical protein
VKLKAQFEFRPLPHLPRWICWLFTRHKMTLEYADYNVDIRGKRCYCGLKWKDELI